MTQETPSHIAHPQFGQNSPVSEFADVVARMSDKFADVVDKLVTNGNADRPNLVENVRAAGFTKESIVEFIPKIKDADPDMDKHDKAFDFLIDCYFYGNKVWRDIDIFNMYSKSFPPGSTRAKIFDNVRREAMAEGRLPGEAKEVLQKLRKTLSTVTSLQ